MSTLVLSASIRPLAGPVPFARGARMAGRSWTGVAVTGQRSGRQPENGPRLRLGRTYQGALEAVLALVVMAVLGAVADSHFGTAPVLILVGLANGFGSFVLRLVRLLNETKPASGRTEPPEER